MRTVIWVLGTIWAISQVAGWFLFLVVSAVSKKEDPRFEGDKLIYRS